MGLLNKLNVKVKEYAFIIIGTIFIAVGVNVMYEPIGLVTGGASGIGIIIKKITTEIVSGGIPLWVTNIIINVPLLIAGYLVKGKQFLKRTVFGAGLLTVMLYLTAFIKIEMKDVVLGSVYGGAITGIGVGLVLESRASTGGSDLLASIIWHYKKQYTIAQIMLVIDAVIVITGIVTFGISNAMYAIIAIIISTKMTDYFVEGLKFQKQVQIISSQYIEISDRIMQELGRGVTVTKGEGMYSRQEKMIILSIISRKEIPRVKLIVSEIDENAFMIINDVREVRGEGFLSIKS